MKIPYFSKPNLEELKDKKITIRFLSHKQEGILIYSEHPSEKSIYKLIYRESENCINELNLEEKKLKYVNKNMIYSKPIKPWHNHKDSFGILWRNKYNELEKILEEHKNEK